MLPILGNNLYMYYIRLHGIYNINVIASSVQTQAPSPTPMAPVPTTTTG